MRGRRGTRVVLGALAVLLAAPVPGAVADDGAVSAHAKKGKKADLVVKDVTGSVTSRSAVVSATVKNKPGKKNGKKAEASVLAFVLSTDPAVGAGDSTLGQVAVPKIKPKRKKDVTASFTVPASVPAGSYYLLACADAGQAVKEKKETNNCQLSAAQVTVASTTPPPPPPATVTVTYASSTPPVGTVSATATNGTCTPNAATGGGVCTVTKGIGTVTLTATDNGATFTTWIDGSSGPCDGTKAGPQVTFTAPAANKGCTAIFGL